MPRELRAGERRVALVPDAVRRLRDAGLDVTVESGAGSHAFTTDDDYLGAGARVVDGDVLTDADVVVTVAPLTLDQAARLRPGAITIGFLPVGAETELVSA
ncbi:MAG: H+-translocating transhydrogenase subunit alpha, partial [Actinomycetota bacterium]|nr:H+-translocating transhydrogenase subunit alpha [Actinomycetota bacterium]